MNREDLETIQHLLEDQGYEVRLHYSGRAIYGAKCLGVIVGDTGHLFTLGQLLHEYDLPTPRTDSMGRDVIAYWPDIRTDEAAAEDRDEDAA
jgi:hypothetical protein